jgi:hypothetical protein
MSRAKQVHLDTPGDFLVEWLPGGKTVKLTLNNDTEELASYEMPTENLHAFFTDIKATPAQFAALRQGMN